MNLEHLREKAALCLRLAARATSVEEAARLRMLADIYENAAREAAERRLARRRSSPVEIGR
jgi:hypothetical protein